MPSQFMLQPWTCAPVAGSHYLFLTQTQHSVMVSENSKAGQEGLVGSIGLTVPLSREDPADLESHFQGALIEG